MQMEYYSVPRSVEASLLAIRWDLYLVSVMQMDDCWVRYWVVVTQMAHCSETCSGLAIEMAKCLAENLVAMRSSAHHLVTHSDLEKSKAYYLARHWELATPMGSDWE